MRFADVDLVGFVYFANYLHYCHIAMEEFIAARCGMNYERLMAEERIGFPTVNAQAEYRQPLVYGDVAEVEVVVSRVGNSSVVFEYSIRRAGDAALCARITLVQVTMNIDERRSMPLPERFRQAFTGSGDAES